MTKEKKVITDPRLKTWDYLNDAVRNADEATCVELLDAETNGRNRLKFKQRIHSRLNKVRADRERKEITNT